jgi:hypothetical protein
MSVAGVPACAESAMACDSMMKLEQLGIPPYAGKRFKGQRKNRALNYSAPLPSLS